jgi:glycerol-3-phosphate dehydrogenase
MFVAGGKWTTYREMAEDAVDKAIEMLADQSSSTTSDDSNNNKETTTVVAANNWKPCSTLTLPLIGTQGHSRSLPVLLQREFGAGLSSQVALHLARTYGGDASKVLAIQKKRSSGGDDATVSPCPTSRKVGTILVEGYPYLEEEVTSKV